MDFFHGKCLMKFGLTPFLYRVWKVPRTFVAGLLLEVYVNFQSPVALLSWAHAVETLDLPMRCYF